MKMILSILFLSFSISNSYAYDIQTVYLKDGSIIDGSYDTYEIPLNKIRAIKISEEDGSLKTILFQVTDESINKREFNQNYKATKMGGDGSGT